MKRKHLNKGLKIGVVIGLFVWFLLGAGLGAAQSGKLTLSLQTSLDSSGDSIKATSITKAELLSTTGTVINTATIIGGTARFDLSGVQAGDYFIRVNDRADDLVPTRIDDPTEDIVQSVGQTLRMAVIGNLTYPTYRIKTFSKGNGEHPIVNYPDGTNETRYSYVLVSLKTDPQRLEVRVLGTAAELTNFSSRLGMHPISGDMPFATWILGDDNHGVDANYGNNDSKCSKCHGDLDAQPPKYENVNPHNGWCFKCHYGKGGDPNGMVDPGFSASSATPTTITPKPTAVVPTATPKAPAFEVLIAVSALLIAILLRRR